MNETVVLDRANGQLSADGSLTGCLKSINRLEGEALFGPDQYRYQVSRTVRGYKISLCNANAELCNISFVSREGSTVTMQGSPEFSYYERRLVQGGAMVAQVHLEANAISVSFSNKLQKSERAALACLLLLDTLYACREGVFGQPIT